ncbi:MAG TPA: GntR family transcriptional regulator [Candidatus Limnocylindria bacterium]|nr:GntR family transcriptional regulator [Candidatus Limnocylindria bacterium]
MNRQLAAERPDDLPAAGQDGADGSGNLRTMSLAEGAAVKIAQEITSGAIRPGQRLPAERELAQRFGLSRGALREGLRTLESVGLVTARVGQGRFVADTGSDRPSMALTALMQVQPSGDIVALRSLLEPALVREMPAAQMAPTAAAAAELLVRMRRAQAAGAINQAVRDHTEFHRLLIRFGATRLSRTLLSSLIEAAAVWQPAILRDRDAARTWVEEHREIVTALETGDIDRAAEQVLAHLRPAFTYRSAD